jgi:iron complex outermembrane receptor protein
MKTSKRRAFSFVFLTCFATASLAAAPKLALAQSADTTSDQASGTVSQANPSLDEVVVSAQQIQGPQAAPSQGSLVATEPQSVIGGSYIRNNDSPLANYTDIIKFTPSVSTVDPNGPGMMENLGTSIRGFQDGFFNVTFDGIPWGDSNDFTHHSTSYFMPQNIGSVVIDRGPGTASGVGNATFGGTVAVESADPYKDATLSADVAAGSFNTLLSGARFDTGQISQWGGTSAFLDVQSFKTNGYLSDASLQRNNAFLKILQPVGDSTTISFVSNLNKLEQHPPIGETAADIAAYGPNYAYNDNPASQAYVGFNTDLINTDYEYLAVNSKFAGWTINNKLYTYAYYHTELAGDDPNGQLPDGTYPAGEVTNGTLYSPSDVPGNVLTNNYRSVGDILRVEHPLGPGVVQFGGWYDHQSNLRQLIEEDFTDNFAYNPAAVAPATLGTTVPTQLNSADRLQHNQLFTHQEYLQYVWTPISAFSLNVGDKLVSFERAIAAPVNQGTLAPLYYDKTWTRNLPSVDAHYLIDPNWSVYVQWAQGFLAPNLNVLYTTNPAESNLQPQSTTNWQAGTAWASSRLSLSADVYDIDFTNELASTSINGIKVFYNLGGTRYRGVEFEGTYVVGAGFSLYGSGAVDAAHATTDGTWVPDAPVRTAALGLQYQYGPVQASLMDHYIGMRYGNAENANPLGGYATTDAAVNYHFLEHMGLLQDAQLSVTLSNLFNNQSIYFLNGTTAGGQNLYFTIPGRSVMVSLSARM